MFEYLLTWEKIGNFSYINVIVIFTAIYLLWYMWIAIKAKKTLPPGPFPYPLVGNSLTLGRLAHISLHKMAQKYGDVMTVFIGPNPVVIISGAKLIRDCLVKKPYVFSGRPDNYLIRLAELPIGTGGITEVDYNHYVKLHRRIAHDAIRSYVLTTNNSFQYEKFVTNEAVQLIRKFTAKEGKPFTADLDIMTMVSKVTISLLCGQDNADKYMNNSSFYSIFPRMKNIVSFLCINNILDTFPFIADLLLVLSKMFRSDLDFALQWVNKLLVDELKYHKETFDKDNIRDITDAMLKAKEEAELEGRTDKAELLDDIKIIGTLADLFAAAIISTSSTIEWFILYMIANPDVQDKVHQEIDDVIGRNRYPTIQDKEKLIYLQAAILETLRLSSISPLLLPHKAMIDTQVNGHNIPAGAVVWFNVSTVHHDEKSWPNANKFDPTRHITSENTIQTVSPNLMAFSAGIRGCLGEPLAKFNLYIFIAHLMQCFEFKKVGNEQPDLTPRCGFIGSCKQCQLRAIPRN